MRGRQTFLLCVIGAVGVAAIALLGRRSGFRPKLSRAQIEAAEKAGVDPVIEIDLGGGVTMTMVLIPPGTFMMGSPTTETDRDSDETQHEVTLTRPFYMGITEVTQAQWEAVTGTRPWEEKDGAEANPERPMNRASWYGDVDEFLPKLNAKVRGGGFRLPTEAEWEYACRAGSTTRFHYGDDPDYSQLGRYAWYEANTKKAGEPYPHAVGTKQPNAYGLYDMHGNVWEWCQDWYAEYPRGRAIDPVGGERPRMVWRRALRGGSWRYPPRYSRSAYRLWLHSMHWRDADYGFRCVRTVATP